MMCSYARSITGRPTLLRSTGGPHLYRTAPTERCGQPVEEVTRSLCLRRSSPQDLSGKWRPPAPTGGRPRCLGCLAQGASTVELSDTVYSANNRPPNLCRIVTKSWRSLPRQLAGNVKSHSSIYTDNIRWNILPDIEGRRGLCANRGNSSRAALGCQRSYHASEKAL